MIQVISEPGRNARSCGRCGALLAPSALQELCPRCLMELNFVASTGLTADEEKSFGGDIGQSSCAGLPSPADIGAHFPHLEILECLGRGGMGIVYKARQTRLNRLVALKVLAPEKERTTQFSERFSREALALARLNHPSIVAVYDFGEADGLYYLLMEYVDGLSLRDLLLARKISPEEALAIVPKICEALQYAHEHGVVHRDIKPENVLLDKGGQVKIADFGVAKMVGGTDIGRALTQDRQVLGTPYYMAPEQVEHPERVDHRADIYSLGVVFYEMLTGELPLGKFQPPSEKVQGDARLDDVVLRALEKEPEHRYQQASEVKSDVETIASTPPEPVPGFTGTLPGPADIRPLRSSGIQSRWITAARWTARVLGTLMLMAFVGMLMIEGMQPLPTLGGREKLASAAWCLALPGFVLGWKFEGAAALLIGLGWALFPVAQGLQPRPYLSPLPLYVVVAALYALCWWTTHGRRTRIAAAGAGAVLAVLLTSFMLMHASATRWGVAAGAPQAGRNLMNPQPDAGARMRIPERAPQASRNLIDLTSHYNSALGDNWHDPWDAGGHLGELPIGVQTLAGTPFDVRGWIQVAQESKEYPPRVDRIVVGVRCARLHFLHAAINAALIEDGTPIGRYVVHYTGGQQQEIPITLGVDLADWFTQETNRPFVLAWTGENPKSRRAGQKIHLFKSTWQNPLREIPIESVDFLTLRPGPSPFLVALTAE